MRDLLLEQLISTDEKHENVLSLITEISSLISHMYPKALTSKGLIRKADLQSVNRCLTRLIAINLRLIEQGMKL